MARTRSLTKSDAEIEADELVQATHPGFREPLRIAHAWTFKGEAWLPAAIRVLEHFRKEYPTAVQIGAELVLAYLQAGKRDEAERELAELERTFQVDRDEETLCRFGRLHREIGDDWVANEKPTEQQFLAASKEYEIAWDYYDRAFRIPIGDGEVRQGHYPGINRAELYLLRAWVARAKDLKKQLLTQAKEACCGLLARRTKWPNESPEDVIWHLASAAEAELISECWDEAIANYRSAVTHRLAAAFHRDSIGKSVRRLKRPLKELCNLPNATSTAIDEVFAKGLPIAASQ